MDLMFWVLIGTVLAAIPAVWFLVAPSHGTLRPLNERMATQVTESAELTRQCALPRESRI